MRIDVEKPTFQKNYINLLLLIASIANKANKIENILEKLLSETCLYMGWSIGHAYILDKHTGKTLESANIWYSNKQMDHIADFAKYKEINEEFIIDNEEKNEIICKVMKNKTAMWITDLDDKDSDPKIELLHKCGIQSVFACPVVVQEKIVSILIFCSEINPENEPPGVINLVKYIAQAIAPVYERESASKELAELNYVLSNRTVFRSGDREGFEERRKDVISNSNQRSMSEIATEILHNVGNILNSINVSLDFIINKNNSSSVESLCKANDLLLKDDGELSKFLKTDAKSAMLFEYCNQLSHLLKTETNEQKTETEKLKAKLQVVKDIIDNQQSFAKGCVDSLEEVSLEEVVEKALSLQTGLAAYSEVDIVKNFFPAPNVFVQQSKLIHVIINLIKNAKEAVHEGNNDLKQVIVEINKTPNGQACLKIKDTGIGMTKETLDRLFTYGFTTKYHGHGFGLHSCVSAIKSMNSDITATSEGLNKGSQFSITFPIK